MRVVFLTFAAAAVLTACAGHTTNALPPQSASPLSPSAHGTAEYSVTALATLGGSSASAAGINNIDWVTGASTLASGSYLHAAVWQRDAAPLDLGTLGGPNSAVAWPIKNVHGEIAGIAETPEMQPLGENWSCALAVFPSPPSGHVCLAFLWRGGKMSALATLGGDNGFGTGVNNEGSAVGWAETAVRDPTCLPPQVLQFEAVEWNTRTGVANELAPYPGDQDGAATAIDDAGQVVGISGICDQAVGRFSAAHAVMWDRGKPLNLGSLGGVAWNTPMAVDAKGDVAGFSDLPGDGDGTPNFHAFLWTKGTGMRDLGVLPGDTYSEALGINDSKEIVGVSYDASFNGRAFVYRDGQMQDLNTLIPPGSSLALIYANDINDRGEITGGACVLSGGSCTSSAPVFIARPANHGRNGVRTKTASRGAVASPSVRRMLLRRLGLWLRP